MKIITHRLELRGYGQVADCGRPARLGWRAGLPAQPTDGPASGRLYAAAETQLWAAAGIG